MTPSSPTVSVVIITLDRPTEVTDCLASLAQQTVPLLEVLVVDASAGTATQERVEQARANGLPARHLAAARGVAYQRRVGAEAAQGDVVLYIDDDVLLETGFVAAILDVFRREDGKRIGGVTGHNTANRRRRVPSVRNLVRWCCFLPMPGSGRFRLSGMHTTANGRRGVRRVEYLGGAFTAYRRDVLAECPPDSERFPSMFEDVDLAWRVSRRYRNYYTEHARCVHLAAAAHRPSAREHARKMSEAYATYWHKNVPQTPWRRLFFRLAYAATRAGCYHWTGRDYASFAYRAVTGRRRSGEPSPAPPE
jgi:glycosyltransferase involved in cell wall biosynthesis